MILKRKTAKGKIRYGVRVDSGSKQRWIGTFATLGEARTAEAKARTSAPATKVTCDKYAEHYLEGYRRRVKGSSYDTAASALSQFIEDWRGVPLSQVIRMEAEKWARKNEWRVPVVVTLMNAAEDAELIHRNPFKGLSNKGPGRRDLTPLTVAEVDQLAAIAERIHGPTMSSFVIVAAYSAMRTGEMFGLEWGDVDFENEAIYVRRRIYRGDTDLPKSNKTRRVNMLPQARAALLRLDRTQDWVFANKRGNRMSASALSYQWQGIIGAFGRHVTPHELKHFAGYYMHNVMNFPDRVVAEHLGHNDGGKLVRELYGHGNVGAFDEIKRAFSENVVPLRTVQEQ